MRDIDEMMENLGDEASAFNFDPSQNYDPSVRSFDREQLHNMAQFNIKIKRLTSNIPLSLPFALFAPQEAENGYQDLLSVTGGTLIVTGDNTKKIFTWTVGADVDAVEVTCPTYPYPSLLFASALDRLNVAKVRYSLGDATKVAQFDEDFTIVSRTLLGARSENKVSVGAYKRPEQFQSGIVDVNAGFGLDKQTAIINSIINAGAVFEINLSLFVPKIIRFDKRALRG